MTVTYRSSLACRLKVPTLKNATQAVDAEMTSLSAKSSAQSLLLLSFHFQIFEHMLLLLHLRLQILILITKKFSPTVKIRKLHFKAEGGIKHLGLLQNLL